MKFENGDAVFESTGRREYSFGNNFSCDPDDPERVNYGSDGALPRSYNNPLTQEERREIYEFAIAQWKAWIDAPMPED